MGALIVLIIDILILWLLWRSRKKKGKQLPRFWHWVLPSEIILIVFLIIFGIVIPIHFVRNTFPLKQKRTEREMTEIQNSILKYKEDTGIWPTDLEQIIANSPIRQKWKSDYWGTQYKFTQENTAEIQLLSAGKDKIFETSDDLKKTIKN